MAGNKDAFQKAMNQGHSAAWDQEWDRAADYYRIALAEFPNHPQALSSLGLALFELCDFPASLEVYQKAAAVAAEDPAPVEKIARIQERLGCLDQAVSASLHAAELHLKVRSVEKAIDNWLHVLSLQPENTVIRTKLAAVYERLGRKDEAITEYISTASAFQRAGDQSRAVKVVQYAQSIAPQNQEVQFAVAMLRSGQTLPIPSRPKGGTGPVLMALLRERQAQDSANGKPVSAAGQNPVQEAAQEAIIQLAGLLFDQAEEVVNTPTRQRGLNAFTQSGAAQSNENSAKSRVILHLGQAIDSHTQGDNQQAVVELEHAVQLGMNHPAAYYTLGLLLKDSDSERALRYLQQAIKHPDYTLAGNLLLALLYEKMEQWKEAAAAYLQALSLADAEIVGPQAGEELITQYEALIDAQSGVDDPSALQGVCKSIASQLLRDDWRVNLNKARQQLPAQTEGSPLVPVAEMVMETRGTQVVEVLSHIRALANQGMLRSAMEEALYALQYAPAYLPLHILLGDLLFQDGHIQDAVRKFTVVASLYLVRGETTRAVRLYQRIAQIMPMDISVRQRLIDLLASQGNVEEALQEYSNLADLFYNLAELDKARQTCMDALKLAQRSKDNRAWGVRLLQRAADIDMQRLNFRQALRIFEQVRTIQPDNLTARAQIVNLNFRLGQDQAGVKELDDTISLLDAGGQRSQAIIFVNDVLAEYPRRPDLHKRLADLHIRSGQIQEAITELDACADALLAEGKHLEAVNLLETILSLKPANEDEYRAALVSLRREMLRK